MPAIFSSLKDKSFLSFTFNGVDVNSLGLAVVSNGDRYSLSLQPTFTNSFSTIPGKIGSFYWGTQITGKSISIALATDCMDYRDYMNAVQLFKPGNYGKFSFAQTDFCESYALVQSVSQFSFIPFESEKTVNGIKFNDTIFKGNMTLSFFFPDPYFYGKESVGNYIDDHVNQPWALASGLPFKNKVGTYQNLFLQNGQLLNAQPTITKYYCYNAGNAQAKVDFRFTDSFSVSSNEVSWTDYKVEKLIVSKPRMFRDIDYTLSLLTTYESSFAQNKVQILDDMRDTLDSALKSELTGIVLATGGGLHWPTVAQAKTAIAQIITGVDFSFSINGYLRQSLMSATLMLHVFGQEITTQQTDVVENIEDSINGEYLVIEGSKGIGADGSITPQSITLNKNPKKVEINFLNTYGL